MTHVSPLLMGAFMYNIHATNTLKTIKIFGVNTKVSIFLLTVWFQYVSFYKDRYLNVLSKQWVVI